MTVAATGAIVKRSRGRRPFETWGIYLDDFTSGTQVYGNIVANSNLGGIFIHGGSDNIVENNVIIEGGKGQMVYSSISPTTGELREMLAKVKEMAYRKYPLLATIMYAQHGTKMSGNKFLNNIIYYSDPKALLYDIHGDLDLLTIESDYNTIYSHGSTLLIPYVHAPAGCQWSEWIASGKDKNSIIADPLFSDAVNGNYRIVPDSPAKIMGFKPIPVEKIGPYRDTFRASWPIYEN